MNVSAAPREGDGHLRPDEGALEEEEPRLRDRRLEVDHVGERVPREADLGDLVHDVDRLARASTSRDLVGLEAREVRPKLLPPGVDRVAAADEPVRRAERARDVARLERISSPGRTPWSSVRKALHGSP